MSLVDGLNALGLAWASFMTRALIDATVLLVVVLAIWLPLRRRMSAQFAHGLFLLVLLKLVVPIPASWSWTPSQTVRRVADRVSEWTRPDNPAAVAPALEPAEPLELPTTGDLGSRVADAPPPQPVVLAAPKAVEPAAPAPPIALSATAVLMLAWAAGSVALLVRFVLAIASTRRLIRRATPLKPEWLPLDLEALRRRAGVRARVRWAVSPRLSSPAVGGLFHPTVVIPPDLEEGLTPKQLSWVLLHELAHVRRGDLWVVIIERLAQAVFFFHPAVHLASWIMDQLREYACDDVALAASKTSRLDCGEGFLTVVSRSVEWAPAASPALGLFESRMLIRRRLLRILDKRRKVHERLSAPAMVALLVLGLIVLPYGRGHDASAHSQPTIDALRFVADATEDPAANEPASYRPGTSWHRTAHVRPGAAEPSRVVVLALAYSPDGKIVATAGDDAVVVLRDVASGAELYRLEGHRDAVSCLAFSPDGKMLATGSYDHTIKLWDVADGHERATLRGHTNWVFALAFSPDGATLASGGHDRSVRLWNVWLGIEEAVLTGHTASVRALAFAPGGWLLATGGADRVVRLWDPETHAAAGTLKGHRGTVRALAFSPGGDRLASAGEDGESRVWDVASKRRLLTLTGHSDMVSCLAFTPSGGTLATGSLDTTVKLWDLSTGKERTSLQGHTDGISALAFAPGASQMATGSFDGTVRLWEPAAPIFSPANCLAYGCDANSIAFASQGRILLAAGGSGVARWDARTGTRVVAKGLPDGSVLAASPDGTVYAVGDDDGQVRLVDAASNRTLATFRGTYAVRSLAFAPDGRLLACGDDGGIVRVWEVANRHLLAASPRGKGPITCVRIAVGGRLLASACGGEVRLWDLATRQERGVLNGHEGDVTGLAFAPDGKLLATSGADGFVRLWDPITRAPRQSLKYADCRAVTFSRDGRYLASAHRDGDVILWDVEEGRQVGELRGHRQEVADLTFSPNGRVLATVGRDGAVKLWSLAARRVTARATLKGDLTPVWSVAYSPDGKTLAVADGPLDTPGSITLWDLATRKVTLTLEGHERGVATTAFSPDGNLLASGGWDGSIRIWDAHTGALVHAILGLDGVTELTFSPDGKTLASAGEGKLVTLWDVETGEETARLTDFRSAVQTVAFSPDGRYLATGGGVSQGKADDYGEVKLWDVGGLKVAATLEGHTGAVLALAFSPDSRTLATGSIDQSARIWDIPSGQSRLVLGGLPNCVQALAFSRDGRNLAWSGRNDGLVLLHDTSVGTEVARLVGHSAVVRAIAFAPDGKSLATGGADRTIKLWDAPAPGLARSTSALASASVSASR